MAGLAARMPALAGYPVDVAAALVLAAGATAGVMAGPGHRPLVLAAAAVTTGSVAFRRLAPVATAAVAMAGYATFELSVVSSSTIEPAALAFVFYTLGRESAASRRLLAAAAGLTLASAILALFIRGDKSLFSEASGWALFVAAPAALGRGVAHRRAIARKLASVTAELGRENATAARRAAAEERLRIARELHDAVAHSVTVMVIQTAAARRVAPHDWPAASAALRVAGQSGREVLAEMRGVIGVLNRAEGGLIGTCPAGSLDALVRQARAAGLDVTVRVRGDQRDLPPDLDNVMFRVVQEALTNTIKHAGPGPVEVTLGYGERLLELDISDTGSGAGHVVRTGIAAGHGLAGMRERLSRYGGQLQAGRTGGGFRVSARLPLDRPVRDPDVPEPTGPGTSTPRPARAILNWAAPLRRGLERARSGLDAVAAAVLCAALSLDLLSDPGRRGPSWLVVLLAVMATTGWAGRHRAPLTYAVVTLTACIVLAGPLGGADSSVLPVYATLGPAYAVSAGTRRRATAGLAICLTGVLTVALLGPPTLAGYLVGLGLCVAAWTAGRGIRSWRALAGNLECQARLLASERADRQQLAIAEERTRIARETHAAIATRVSTMVVQTTAAQLLGGRGPAQVDEVLQGIEQTGRDALTELRSLLGVLRRGGSSAELARPAGLGQVHVLAEDTGQPRHDVARSVNDENALA